MALGEVVEGPILLLVCHSEWLASSKLVASTAAASTADRPLGWCRQVSPTLAGAGHCGGLQGVGGTWAVSASRRLSLVTCACPPFLTAIS